MGDFGSGDVADALGRLAAVAAEKGCQVDLTQTELLERWHTVATAASHGAIDAVSLDSLRLIFNYIETVIISCGSPDAFDVYETSFETLTKMGFVLPDLECKHLIMQLLEHVNEVYDVLLSCVETYEWVQPGATGLLRLWMLQVLFAVFGADRMTGRDLMELTDNDVSGAISLIASVLRCEQAPYEMQAASGRCLVELTTADCVFLGRVDEDTNTQQISKLTTMLNNHVNGLIKGLIQFEVVEAFGRCICQHQQSHSHTDVIVNHFLTTVHNSLLYCSQNQQKLRQHLATQSTIVQDIMIPYVHNILPALYDNPNCNMNDMEFQNLKSAMQTFVVVTFNIKVFRPQLRDSDLVCRLCDVPNILKYVSMLELLIKMAINVDFTKGPYMDQIQSTLKAAFEALPLESQERLQRRISSEQGMRLPFSRSSTHACDLLSFALVTPLEAPEQKAERKQQRKHAWRTAKNKAKKRRRMFGLQAKGFNNGPDLEPGEEADEDNSEEDDMPPLLPAENWEGTLGETDDSFVPSMAKCQLGGGIMHDPVRTPDGFLFERAALEDWVQTHGSNPATGAPLSIAEAVPATDVASFIQGYQPTAPDVAPPAKAEMPAPAPVAQASLLGDLPSLGGGAEAPKKKERKAISIASRSVVDCPEEMRCAIDGKVMTAPLKSPYGHRFEKKTLEKWLANCGSVCPITTKPLRLEDCEPDTEMKKTIVRFLKGQS